MAAPAFAAIGTHLSGLSGTATSFAVPAAVAAGDIIVIPIYVDGAATLSAMPAGFAHAPNSPIAGSNHSLVVVWKRATGADSGTYDFTLSTTVYRAGAAIRYTGCVASGSPWDVTNAAADNTNATVTPPVAVTTTGADRLLFFAGTNWAGGAWTEPSGFTERIDNPPDRVSTADDKAQAVAGGSGNISATCAGSDKRTAWLGALLPATGGASSVTLTPVTVTRTAVPVTPVPQPVTVTLTPVTITETAVPVTPAPQPGAVTLTPVAVTRTAVPVTPVPQPVTVTLTPVTITRTAVPVSPGPQPVTVTLTPVAVTRMAVPVSPVPQPVTVALTPVSFSVGAVALGLEGGTPPAGSVTLVPVEIIFQTVRLVPVGGTVPLNLHELPMAQALLECLEAALAENPFPPARACLRVGEEVRQDISMYEDECCDGLAYVKVNQSYPSIFFPDPIESPSHCATDTWAVDLEMGVFRCSPTGDESHVATCDAWTNTVTQVAHDQAAMRQAVACFRGTMVPGDELMVRPWLPLSTQGGCAGGTQIVTASFFESC